jgi:hypothetical protein
MALSFYGSGFHGANYHSSGYYRPTADVVTPPTFPAGGPGGPGLGETYNEDEEIITLIAMMIETGMFDDG